MADTIVTKKYSELSKVTSLSDSYLFAVHNGSSLVAITAANVKSAFGITGISSDVSTLKGYFDANGILKVANGGTANSSVDTEPVQDSTKMITSGAVYTAINGLTTDAFKTVSAGGASMVASGADTLTITGSNNITLTGNASTKTLNIAGYTHPTPMSAAKTEDLYTVAINTNGHITAATKKTIDTSATSASTNLITSGAVYTGLSGKVAGISSSTDGGLMAFSGTGGKTAKKAASAGSATKGIYLNSNGVPTAMTYSVEKDVPADAVFTDTVYTHPTYTSRSSNLYKITVNSTGHVSAATAVTIDSQPTSGNTSNLVSSGGVYSWVNDTFSAMLHKYSNPNDVCLSTSEGHNLGTSLTDAQSTKIKAGDWEDFYVGDYWTINSHKYYIAHIDYYYGVGDVPCATHHLVLVPATGLPSNSDTKQMNTTNTTAGGYTGSAMFTTNLGNSASDTGTAGATLYTDFGADHLLEHRVHLSTDNSNPCSMAWFSRRYDLMDARNVYAQASDTGNAGYGSRWDQAENGVRMTDFQVFRLFRDGKAAANEYRAVYAGYNWWMRNLEYTFMSGFLYVSSGPISGWTSEHSFGVRPSVTIC